MNFEHLEKVINMSRLPESYLGFLAIFMVRTLPVNVLTLNVSEIFSAEKEGPVILRRWYSNTFLSKV